jgi:hypothetical protein
LPVVVEVDQTAPVDAPSGGFRLRPGMFVTIKIKGLLVDQAYLLPRSVVYPGDVVYIFEDDQLKIKEVGILRSYKDSVIIVEGISEGDQIISTPLSGAVDGMRLRVKAGDG